MHYVMVIKPWIRSRSEYLSESYANVIPEYFYGAEGYYSIEQDPGIVSRTRL